MGEEERGRMRGKEERVRETERERPERENWGGGKESRERDKHSRDI